MLSLCAAGCLGIPNGVAPVNNFELDAYLGTWHEVARLDHRFERNLQQVTATYALRDDGGVSVLNRGWNSRSEQWEQAQGRAYFVGDSSVGHLKVSFFGPFYGSYVVFEKDARSAEYAFVSGPNHSYLWLLSRTPQVSVVTAARFQSEAKRLGFPVNELIWLNQPQQAPSNNQAALP